MRLSVQKRLKRSRCRLGPWNQVLDGAQVCPFEWGFEGAIIRGKDMPGNARRHSAVSSANKCSTVAEMGDRLATIDMGCCAPLLDGDDLVLI